MNFFILAYYLPQFHAIPENDHWWGSGFTEWTSVGKAKPLFREHYQPRVPKDLGYYNLLMPEVRDAQAKMAKAAGVNGFCYWHYWFGDGKRLLEKPFNEVLASGKPDFPFCLGWANESWKAKVWSDMSGTKSELLIEQKFGGEEDNRKHFETLLPAFQDIRYFKFDGCPVFLIYRPFAFDAKLFIRQWNQWLKQATTFPKFYFIAQVMNEMDRQKAKDLGFDAVTLVPGARFYKRTISIRVRAKLAQWLKTMLIIPYSKAIQNFSHAIFDIQEDVIPFILPNWDHSPRSGKNAVILHKSTPKLFKDHVRRVLSIVKKKNNKLIILKSWNEWGEGNYMEPDLKFGNGYIKALREAIDESEG